MKQLKDLRKYISVLDSMGELQEIDVEVDWNLEIGAIIRRAYDLRAPAPLFNNIKDIEEGFRVLGGSAGLSAQNGLRLARIAISLGFSPDTGAKEIVNTISDAILKEGIPPSVVDSGACHENILTGDEIDLMRFPVPFI
ncbi:MAG: UbiD family decarboxylase, partial [Candidatus Dadabacteria bacterium]